LKKDHFVIAKLHHENRELKKKSLEKNFKEDISLKGEQLVLSISVGSKINNKGKAIERTPKVRDIPQPNMSLTRSSTKKFQNQ
jgi:hypothetical protein